MLYSLCNTSLAKTLQIYLEFSFCQIVIEKFLSCVHHFFQFFIFFSSLNLFL